MGEQGRFGNAVDAGVGKDFERAALLGIEASHRHGLPGSLSRRSIQFGIAVAPSLPHRLQRMRGPNHGTGTSSGQASTLSFVLCSQCWQVTHSPRTPFRRMLPSVIGWIGSSGLVMPPIRTSRERESRGCYKNLPPPRFPLVPPMVLDQYYGARSATRLAPKALWEVPPAAVERRHPSARSTADGRASRDY
jgi:hypothetical protein